MQDKNPLAHYSGVLSQAVQESAAADVPASGAAALSAYLQDCEQHSIVPDVGGAFASAFAAGFNLAAPKAASDKRTDLVPGVMRCAKCEFQLVRQILAVNLGEVFAGDSKTEPCPNGCGPLWPVTWKQYAEQAMDAAETMADRAFAAEKEVKQLRGELAQHPDDVAVDALTALMKSKLAKQRDKGYGGWDDTECSQQHLSNLLRGHVEKGDPVDVANFCAFLSARGEGIAPQAAPAAVAVPDERAAFEKWASFVGYSTKRWQADANLYEDNATEDAWIAWQARAALAATPAAAPDMVSVKKVDANNYCRILAALGMEEEGDPVAEVQNLLAGVSAPAAQAVERIVHLRVDRKRRIYVAGPMTGLPEFNFPAFNSAADKLRAEEWHVENPAEHGHIEGADWADYLRWDISRIATCGAIYLLPGWENSKGATLEVSIAKALGMQFVLAPGAAPQAQADARDDSALLDAMERQRIAVVPEYEGPWDAEVYNDEGKPNHRGGGLTPREAIRAAIAAQAAQQGGDKQ